MCFFMFEFDKSPEIAKYTYWKVKCRTTVKNTFTAPQNYDPAIPSQCITKKIKNKCPHQKVDTNVHGSIIRSSQKEEHNLSTYQLKKMCDSHTMEYYSAIKKE